MQPKKAEQPMYSTKLKFTFSKGEIFDFVPIQPLGEGSYGAVFKCYSKKLARFFAVKKSNLDIERPEVGIVKELNLDGFCPNYITLMNQYFQFNVMQLCHETISYARTFMNQSSRLHVLARVAEILSDMHKFNAYHGDIKQNNILFKVSLTDFKIFLSDFGLSKKFSERNQNQELKEAMNFLRLVHKMANIDTDYFPTTIIWEQFQPLCLKKGMRLKTHWKSIFKFLLPLDYTTMPPMAQIAKLVRKLADELAQIVPTNFQTLFLVLKKTKKDVTFEENENIQFPENVFGDKTKEYIEITPTKTDLPSDSEESPEKSPQKAKRRSRLNKKLPKNLWKADKKRKKKFSEKKQFYFCPNCQKRVDRKNTRHKKNCHS